MPGRSQVVRQLSLGSGAVAVLGCTCVRGRLDLSRNAAGLPSGMPPPTGPVARLCGVAAICAAALR
eukprot:15455731-Alexandrium_andersonii.AAC.1